jgi:hypothetical protein
VAPQGATGNYVSEAHEKGAVKEARSSDDHNRISISMSFTLTVSRTSSPQFPYMAPPTRP